MANVVIVSNRLPMSVRKEDGKLVFGQSMGGLATGLSDYTKRRGTKWIGWPGIPSDDLTKAEQAQITKELRKHRCYPVFLTKKQIDDYYNGYSNSVVWPLFHNLQFKSGEAKLWKGYREANKLFADTVLRLAKPQSVIWEYWERIWRDFTPAATRGNFWPTVTAYCI
jgi:trehalose 6-phosphate synthase/phosphatase